MRRVQRPLLALASGVLATLVLWATPSAAQTWPQRPVKFVLTLGAGSGVDIGARLFADRLSTRWGQPVVVENRPGGDGIVAISSFVAAHDDHVLLMSPTSSFTAHPFLHENLTYKPSDLQPIARVSNTVVTIGVPASMNIKSLDQLFALVRAQPGKLNWAGVTGALDFLFDGYLKSAGLDMAKVPYRNPVDAANDLAEGRVQVYEAALAIVRPRVQSGKIKLLAVTNTERAPAEPDLPTVKEAGYPGTHHRRPRRPVRSPGNADRAARAHRRGFPGGVGRPGHRGSIGVQRADPQYRRAGRIREVDRRAARRGRQDGEDARGGGEAVRSGRARYFLP